MKLNQLLEARLARPPQNHLIARWMSRRLLATLFDRGRSYAEGAFISTANQSGPKGGLQNAVEAVQEYNAVIEFIHKHSDNRDQDVVSPQQLEKWVRLWNAT
ncbi:hypothetical protein LCGC14_1600450 [marine sediment metagenome]|uniref:Uncharacterized protein n=1 Tax=marine sediment metagenome TaxID=412755 RepID=A0A0F9IBM5_9ZZZZ